MGAPQGGPVELPPSEQRVLDVLHGLGDELQDITASAVARKAGTAVSTVIRLAHRLGHRGFPELRLARIGLSNALPWRCLPGRAA